MTSPTGDPAEAVGWGGRCGTCGSQLTEWTLDLGQHCWTCHRTERGTGDLEPLRAALENALNKLDNDHGHPASVLAEFVAEDLGVLAAVSSLIRAEKAAAFDEGWEASCDWHDEDMRRDFGEPLLCKVVPCDAVPADSEDAAMTAGNPYTARGGGKT